MNLLTAFLRVFGIPALAAGASRAVRRSLWGSTIVLVVVNFIPVIAVAMGWATPGGILVAYWLETLVIGALTVVRIVTATGAMDDMKQSRWGGRRNRTFAETAARPTPVLLRILLAGFFCFHFGLFATVHGVFVNLMAFGFGGIGNALGQSGGPGLGMVAALVGQVGNWAVVALVGFGLSHTWSLVRHWFMGAEHARVSAPKAMMAPYGRVVVLHLVLMASFVFVVFSTGDTVAMWLLVGVKLAIDAPMHIREHLKLSQRSGQAARSPATATDDAAGRWAPPGRRPTAAPSTGASGAPPTSSGPMQVPPAPDLDRPDLPAAPDLGGHRRR